MTKITGPKDIRVLWLEDDDEFYADGAEIVQLFNEDREIKIIIERAKTIEDAVTNSRNGFSYALIDLRIGTDGDAGRKVIEGIKTTIKLPIIIYTGTPGGYDAGMPILKVHVKGESTMVEVLETIHAVSKTGLDQLLSEGGQMDSLLREVFWKTICPQIDTWIKYSTTEKYNKEVMLRYVVANLVDRIKLETPHYMPMEFYVIQIDNTPKTGLLIRDSGGNGFIILSPACDLAIRADGSVNTDSILLAAIEPLEEKHRQHFSTSSTWSDLSRDVQSRVEELSRNKNSMFRHFLPKANGIDHGTINFRKLSNVSPSNFKDEFSSCGLRVSPEFMKDISARFSSYYGRQGQPELHCSAWFA